MYNNSDDLLRGWAQGQAGGLNRNIFIINNNYPCVNARGTMNTKKNPALLFSRGRGLTI
jgi:hypothetical protein